MEKGRQMTVWSLKMAIFASFIHYMSYEHFTYMATRQLSRDRTVDDLAIFQSHQA